MLPETDNARELAVLADPELMASIRDGIQQAAEGRTSTIDFSAYIEEPPLA